MPFVAGTTHLMEILIPKGASIAGCRAYVTLAQYRHTRNKEERIEKLELAPSRATITALQNDPEFSHKVSVTLTQEETLKFVERYPVHVQVEWISSNGTVGAIIACEDTVYRNLKGKTITYG